MAKATPSPEGLRRRLLERRQELEELIDASRDDRAAVELDQTRVGRLSRADALQGQAMSQETTRRRQGELSRIDAALARLEAGDYGYCVSCGDEIAPQRLALDPTLPTCIGCARKSGA